MRRDFEGGEGVENLDDIDDPRNGFCGELRLHPLFDQNICGVLKVIYFYSLRVLSAYVLPDTKSYP